MNRAALTLIACLFALNTAVAQKTLEVIEGAGEYLLSHIEVPANTTGSLELKPCVTCATQLLRVTESTQYHVNGSRLPLTEFAAVAAELRAGNADRRTLVSLFVDRESHNVTRVFLFRPPQ